MSAPAGRADGEVAVPAETPRLRSGKRNQRRRKAVAWAVIVMVLAGGGTAAWLDRPAGAAIAAQPW